MTSYQLYRYNPHLFTFSVAHMVMFVMAVIRTQINWLHDGLSPPARMGECAGTTERSTLLFQKIGFEEYFHSRRGSQPGPDQSYSD